MKNIYICINLEPLDDVLSPLQPPVGGGHGVEHQLAALVDAQPVVGEHRVRPGVVHGVIIIYRLYFNMFMGIRKVSGNETSVETTCLNPHSTVLIFEEP